MARETPVPDMPESLSHVWILGGCDASRERVRGDLEAAAAQLGHGPYEVLCASDAAAARAARTCSAPACVLLLAGEPDPAALIAGLGPAHVDATVSRVVLVRTAEEEAELRARAASLVSARLGDLTPVALAWIVAGAVSSTGLRGALARQERDAEERARDASFAREELERTIESLEKVRGELERAHQATQAELARSPVSGLPARAHLLQQLDAGLAAGRRYGHGLGVLYVDIDDFRCVNELVGHALADRVLAEVARRVAASTRASDFVAHVSGNAFAVLLARIVTPSGAGIVARKIQAAVAEPIVIRGERLGLTCSVGIAVFPGDGDTGEMLLSRAHTAMSASKRLARAGVAFFDAATNERSNRDLVLEGALREAVREGQLSLVYQPQVGVQSGQLVGAEALLRWEHPTLGWQSPAAFIPVAERSELIVDIGDWVLREALAQGAVWDAAGVSPFPVSVNVSLRQLRRPDFADSVATHVYDSGLPPERLRVEITETSAMMDPSIVRDQLERLRRFGIGVSLDDFGVGYSSLSALESLPVDTLKLDRTFIHDVHRNPRHEAVAAAVIALARGFACDTVAEGVETEAELERIRELGYAKAQGYLLARPLTPAAFADWLTTRTPPAS